jgi:hypothetical protein
MDQFLKPTADQDAAAKFKSTAYRIVAKVFKYSFYITVLYFAYEGFMAWE